MASKAWLVFASLFFYSWWSIIYLPLILISVLFNYMISNAMLTHEKRNKAIFSKKTLFHIGLLLNIGLLAYFKYMDFFIDNVNMVFSSDFSLLHLALPLAISFFTLQQIAFLVDTYEGLAKERNFLDYTLFVTFFPQLIAGPIVHHGQMMPQFTSLRGKIIQPKNIALALFIFSIGLFKKVVLADSFAAWANIGFDKMDSLTMVQAWAASLAYTYQMYFDFSGYTDMAIGAALLFNIRLPQNFNSPYKATGMIDFWKRWHMTLTAFITTYIYTPIIKSFRKLTFHKAMLATLITFLIAGLWHGASWMFVIFGGLHGMGLVINHYWKNTKIKINKYLAWLITFNFINLALLFFRAKNFDDALKVLRGMFGFNEIGHFSSLLLFTGETIDGFFIIVLLIIATILLFLKNSNQLQHNFTARWPTMLFAACLFSISVLSFNKETAFLYFNF